MWIIINLLLEFLLLTKATINCLSISSHVSVFILGCKNAGKYSQIIQNFWKDKNLMFIFKVIDLSNGY